MSTLTILICKVAFQNNHHLTLIWDHLLNILVPSAHTHYKSTQSSFWFVNTMSFLICEHWVLFYFWTPSSFWFGHTEFFLICEHQVPFGLGHTEFFLICEHQVLFDLWTRSSFWFANAVPTFDFDLRNLVINSTYDHTLHWQTHGVITMLQQENTRPPFAGVNIRFLQQ